MKRYLIGFLAGTIVGGAIGYFAATKKNEKESDEIINNMLENHRKRLDELYRTIDELEGKDLEPGTMSFDVEPDLSTVNYSREYYIEPDEPPVDKASEPDTEIEVISPDEYKADENFYVEEPWQYYSDNILATLSDEVVEDVDGTVGRESLNHFGDFGDDEDVLYVKNWKTETYYQVIRIHQTFFEVTGIEHFG